MTAATATPARNAIQNAPPTAAALGSALSLAVRTEQLPRFVEVVSRIAEEEADKERSIELFLVLGRAHDREGGDLRRAAEAYQAAELKHGPLALIDQEMPSVVLAPDDELLTRNIATMEQIKARGGPVIAVTRYRSWTGPASCG